MKKSINAMQNKSLVYLWVLIITATSCSQNNFTIWIASPWQTVMRDTPPGDVLSVNVRAAANEYEAFRIIINNSGVEEITGINVTLDDLKGRTGKIAKNNFQLYRANYHHITKPSRNSVNKAGWYPDALIPLFCYKPDHNISQITYNAVPFSVDKGCNAEVWCDLFVPKGTKPGVYKGKAIVWSDGKKLARIPVLLTVWNFELPSKISMKSHFGPLDSSYYITGVTRLWKIKNDSESFYELEELYNKELLKHRAVPRTPNSIWPDWNEKDGIIDRGESVRLKKLIETDGFNALEVPFRFSDNPSKYKAYLAATCEWLRKLGYLDLAYVYLEDEPNTSEEYEIVRRQGQLIKSSDPEIKRLCTEPPLTTNPDWGDLYGAVDIWCPLWGSQVWNGSIPAERLALGEELWSYTALCQGPKGTPWWQIDMDPVNFRVPMWLSWHYNITGFLYWASVCYRSFETLESIWTSPHFRNEQYWGEGILLYPGQPAGIKGFVPSIRIKLYREAAEDYEYMTMASKLGRGEDVKTIVDSLVTSFQQWNHERDAYELGREKLAELIMQSR